MFQPTPSDSDPSKPTPLIVYSHSHLDSLNCISPAFPFQLYVDINSVAKRGVTLFKQLNCNVLLYDYTGFGKSQKEATPTHSSIKADLAAVMNYALELRKSGKVGSIWLYGHSFGGAVSADYLAHANQEIISATDLLILETPIYSLRELARLTLPKKLRPFTKFIVPNLWNTADNLKHIKTDTLFIYSSNDEVVPFRLATSLPKSSGLLSFLRITHFLHLLLIL